MAFKNLKKVLFPADDEVSSTSEEEFYEIPEDEALKEAEKAGSKMILIEPRANSESVQIADYLKKRNSVVVNLKRVTKDQAKRIIDFLSGCVYAIGGDLQKLGPDIYLCTPRNVNVQGKMSDEDGKAKNIEDEIDF